MFRRSIRAGSPVGASRHDGRPTFSGGAPRCRSEQAKALQPPLPVRTSMDSERILPGHQPGISAASVPVNLASSVWMGAQPRPASNRSMTEWS